MFRSGFRTLTSFVVVAAAPVAVFFLRGSGSPPAAAAAGLRPQLAQAAGTKNEKPAPAGASAGGRGGGRHAGTNEAAGGDGPGSYAPGRAAAIGRGAGEEELDHSVEGFCREYAGTRALESDPLCVEPSARRLYVAIAILPDPVHTHLALGFDRGIDDIEDAMQDLGWTFDHSWLPWDNKVYPPTDRYEDREQDGAEQRGREENPGVLFFRGQDVEEPQSELIVLVVGDSPTAGVNPKQFRGAMKAWNEVVGPTGADPGELAILGPTFSGSVQSLRHLLSEELGVVEAQKQAESCKTYTPPHVDIASGTVTGADLMAGLEAITDVCGHLVASQSFSFGIDSDYQKFQLVHFLRQHHRSANIMRLSEAESSFGAKEIPNPRGAQDLWGVIGSALCAPGMKDCDAQKARQQAIITADYVRQWERRQAEEQPGLQTPVLHFPREISRLRKAYEENSIVGFGSTTNSPRTQLSLSEAGDTHDDDDTVATFSGEQSTLAMETEMSEIATKLSTGNYDVVLLSATDMLDEIFVARYLQQHAPRVTVIVEDADQMFLRTGEDAGLSDVYVASPWPLIEENQKWSGSGDPGSPHLFQSQNDEGLRNAAVYLLCGAPEVDGATGRQTSCGPGRATLYDYRPPLLPRNVPAVVAGRPPLWLSVIGHGQFYPIALVDVDQIPAQDESATILPDAGTLNLPPLPFAAAGAAQATMEPTGTPAAGLDVARVIPAVKIAAALIGALLVWHGLALCWARLDRHFAWTYALAETEHRVCRLGLQAVVSACAIPALGLLLLPDTPGLTRQSLAFRVCLYGLQAIAAGLATWPALRWFCSRKQPHESRAVVVLPTVAVVVGLVASIFLVNLDLWRLIAPGAYTERLFFLYRNAQLLCGSSPALTLGLLLGALAFWLHSQFGRLAFFGHRIPELPKDHLEIYCPSPESIQPLTDLLNMWKPKGAAKAEGVNWSMWLTLLSMLSVALVLVLAHAAGPWSLAHGRFDWLVWALTYLATVLIVRDVAIAFCGWRFLEKLCLQPLKRSHLRWGFSWIKGFSWRRIWTSYRTMSPEVMFDYMMRLKESNQRVGGDDELRETYDVLRKDYYRPDKDRDEAWANRIAEDILEVHRELARAASAKLWRLRQAWSTDRGAVTGPDKKRGMHDESAVKEFSGEARWPALERMADEEFAALLYLGYIRMALIQIRNRIVTACVTYVLLLWALTSYPWMNRHAILISLCLLLALISAATLSIYSEMHRDDILSRTTETESGKLDPEFFGKVIPTIGIPLLTLVATQFPALSTFIFSWVEPGLKGP